MPDGDRLIDLVRTSRALPQVTTAKPSSTSEPSQERQVMCPECGLLLSRWTRSDHLIAAHGYLSISGTLLPRESALACLWDRVFTTGDATAHEQLLQILAGPAVNGQSPYVQALEAELLRRVKTRLFTQPQELRRLVRHLRGDKPAHQHFWQLLTSADSRIRALGQELLLPDSSEALAGPHTSASDVQAWLNKLCPADDVWEKIRLCQRLPNYGVDSEAATDCLRQLQVQRPVACPECGAAIPQRELDEHIQQEHRGQAPRAEPTVEEAISSLLADVLRPDPERSAWETLVTLARRERGAQADSFLAVRLCQELARLDKQTRGQTLDSLAEIIAAGSSGPKITLLLATSSEAMARHLALALVPRLPPPLSTNLVRASRRLLLRRRAPGSAQVAAAAALLLTTGKEGPAADKVINALINRCDSARALDRLHRLEKQAGAAPAIASRASEIESQILLRCPRCDLELRRPEMARHLWTEHSLVLDGRRVRKPWRIVKQWIREYFRGGNAELLVRSRMLGTYLDRENGLYRVHRLVLAKGIDDIEARQILLAEAKERGASLCPACYAFIPAREETMPRVLNQSHGRLSLGGYCADISERGFVPRLVLQTPKAELYVGPEPGRWLTRKGATLLVVGPLVAAALVVALSLRYWENPARWPVPVSLWVAAMVYVGLRIYWRTRPEPVDRAVDWIWTRLVPTLHTDDFSPDDAAFIAASALSSVHRGQCSTRAAILERVVKKTDKAVGRNTAPIAYLAPLKRLQISDMADSGQDPVPALTTEVGRCLRGELPLAYAEWLLADSERTQRSEGDWARLRVLVCDSAFEAGLEVSNLIDAGRTAPALGELLNIERPTELAQLRLLWSLRAHAPWSRWSNPVTVFDLANEAEFGRQLLAKYPDLLLMDQAAPAVFMCGRGVVFQEILFTEHRRSVERRAKRDFNRVDYEVVVEGRRFSFINDPAELARRLEHWFGFCFREFLPRVSEVHSWQAPAGTKPLFFHEPATCPECHRLVFTRLGNLGTLVTD
jgi:uncharacterized C2H2 Zn-finger protein